MQFSASLLRASSRSNSRHQRLRNKKQALVFKGVSHYTGSDFDENLHKVVWQSNDEEGEEQHDEGEQGQQQHDEQGDAALARAGYFLSFLAML